MQRFGQFFVLVVVAFSPILSQAQQGDNAAARPRVYRDRVIPHWLADNSGFWYVNQLGGGAKQFVLVSATAGSRDAAFDHYRVAIALSRAAGGDYSGSKLPFDRIEFADGTSKVRFKVSDKTWQCDLASYECTPAEPSAFLDAPADNRPQRGGQGDGLGLNRPRQSPNGRYTAEIKDHNVYVKASDGEEIQLSTDGVEGNAYGRFEWSPDSQTLVGWRIEPGDRKEVYLIESSPKEGLPAKLSQRPYPRPGDKFTAYELSLFDIENRKQTKPEVERVDFGTPRLHWTRDGKQFIYEKADRGHQRFRIIAVNLADAKPRNLVDDKTSTFIESSVLTRTYLKNTDEIVDISERDGWKHLYLIDTITGTMKPITKGQWVMRGMERIDEEKRQIWFRASGMEADQDPYLIHFYRINFDGTGLVSLTPGNANHTVAWSPDHKYMVVTASRVDLPPTIVLRRAEDGAQVCELESAEISESNWLAPEVFVAKARDGVTDIWGIICRPRNFDPAKKYAVIEDIYAGPQESFVPKTFSPAERYVGLTRLDFIVVKIDGMGTANRSKAFHDVCWQNLKDAGFPDRILWMKAAAEKYPHMDLTRVGVYGTSAGGQNAAGAVLFHPEFYKAAVANCGCHDNRLDKAWWNEQWMGYPVTQCYADSSNIDNAHLLQGHLFLIVGEMDTNVPPESTYRLCDALIKAKKDFDFLMVPGGGHGAGNASAYHQRRMQDFFVKHLQGVDTPNRNAQPTETVVER